MKKYLIYVLCLYFLLCGFTYPSDSPNVLVNCSLGNNVRIYFPVDRVGDLFVSENQIINKSSSTIYGYYGDIRISFSTFEQPSYYSGYNSVNLSITSVLENNLLTTSSRMKLNYSYYVIVLLGGIFVWSLFRIRH